MPVERENNNSRTWTAYSREVINSLTRSEAAIGQLMAKVDSMERDIALMKDREDKVVKIQLWRDLMNDICSPAQFKALMEKVENHEKFQNKWITISAMAVAAVGFATSLLTYLLHK